MKKIILLISISIITSFTSMAAQVDQQTAMTAAKNFYIYNKSSANSINTQTLNISLAFKNSLSATLPSSNKGNTVLF